MHIAAHPPIPFAIPTPWVVVRELVGENGRASAGFPAPDEKGWTMSEIPKDSTSDEHTDIEELNDEGVGGTIGAKDTFEPEESEDPDADKPGNPDADQK